MKILCTGDWHIRETNPAYRIDNFKNTLKAKLNFIKQVCIDNKIDYIIQPGDFFDDASKVSYAALVEWIEFFRGFPPIYTVLGQHDLKNHSLENRNIPAYILQEAGIIKLPAYPLFGVFDGFHYGQPITPENNILIIHAMIINDKKLWDGQEGFVRGKTLLKKYKYNLIVAGDNHQKFIIKYNDKHLINAGSLMRTARNQIEHKPAVFIYDMDLNTVEEILIPIEPFDNVFDVNKISVEQERSEELSALVDTMKQGFTTSLNFMQNLSILKKKADKDTIKILDEIYEV